MNLIKGISAFEDIPFILLWIRNNDILPGALIRYHIISIDRINTGIKYGLMFHQYRFKCLLYRHSNFFSKNFKKVLDSRCVGM